MAIGDEAGHGLRANVVVLIGERLGLSSPDSLCIYVALKDDADDQAAGMQYSSQANFLMQTLWESGQY